MASHILVAALIATVLAVCLIQVTGAEESTTAASLDSAIKTAGETLNKAYNDAKPKFDELLAKGQELFGKLAEEAGKIIPKTDEKPAATA